MKFMKLGTRPDTFFTAEAIRTVSSEVSTDLKIQVQNSIYLLHKFPLLSKCARLQRLCSGLKESSGDTVIRLPDFPGGADAFEACAKFCYGITITLSAHNFVPVRCAAEYLQMSDDIDRGNLISKLEAFFKSCILRRWRDTLVVLEGTRQLPELSERLQITSCCIDAIAAMVAARPSKLSWSQTQSSHKPASRGWWAEDVSELEMDLYWRIMVAVKSSGRVSDKITGEALQIYACKWLPNVLGDGYPSRLMSENCSQESQQDVITKHRWLLERIVSLLPIEKGSLPCSFLLKLLKAANLLYASPSSKIELARRIGVQLEEATVSDLLIPSLYEANKTLYDVDIVMIILEEFMLQGQSPQTSPPRDRLECKRRRSRSAENIDFDGLDNGRRSSSASHSSKLRVAKLIDGYLQEVAKDPNLSIQKLMALAETVPDFARPAHDDLYRVIDIYLRAHPELDKTARKQLCRMLDCKKLSMEACIHAAQNELLPLRVVVQVLFFEQARAAMSGGQVSDLPPNIKELLARRMDENQKKEASKVPHLGNHLPLDEYWDTPTANGSKSKLETLRMKLAEAQTDTDDDFMHRDGLGRSSSSRFKSLCAIPNKPKRIFSKLWTMNRSVSERH